MDLKTWLRRHSVDSSPMGRLISRGRDHADPEQFLVDISKGNDPVLGRQFTALAQGLICEFKQDGGKFKKPSMFERVSLGKFIGGDVIAFRQKPPEELTVDHDVFWTRFYAALLQIDISAPPVEFEQRREPAVATVTILVPKRNMRPRKFA